MEPASRRTCVCSLLRAGRPAAARTSVYRIQVEFRMNSRIYSRYKPFWCWNPILELGYFSTRILGKGQPVKQSG